MSPSPLISATELTKNYGVNPLFSDITLSVGERERVALIGPNGSGKSTLLRMLAGIDVPDHGEVRIRNGLQIAYVAQEDIFDSNLSVAETLEETLIKAGFDTHNLGGKIEVICGHFGFTNKKIKTSSLSGGWRKRLAIACGLVVEPALLLLDEPTNHLDISGVLWLEKFLARSNCTLLFVSHDRYFIDHLASRVIEINRQYPRGFYSSSGTYVDFLESRQEYLIGLHKSKEALANKVRREVAWLRQGAKARTTKSKYRSDQALQLQDNLKKFNLDEQSASLEFAASNRKSKDLIKVEEISKSFNERILFKNVTFTISPGIRLGIVGPNGSGKTTFLKTLLGEIQPDCGRVKFANNLKIAFFDQARSQLDRNVTLKSALSDGGESVVFNNREIHVAGWAERFLFSREQLSLQVGSLSGGEQARVLLAKIMLQQSDILLFDEPTNDLDIKTLEVLEESFLEFPGAIVLITHDRYLLDRTCNIVLGLGDGGSSIYSDYFQWEIDNQNITDKSQNQNNKKIDIEEASSYEKESTKLSYNQKRELETIEKDILRAESIVDSFKSDIESGTFANDPTALRECCQKLSIEQQRVDELYNRWQELDELKRKFSKSKKY